MKRERVTHIPDVNGKTYCGRLRFDQRLIGDRIVAEPLVACIDPKRDVVDSATCKACQRSDDRRGVEADRETQRLRPDCSICDTPLVERYKNGKNGARGRWCPNCESWKP